MTNNKLVHVNSYVKDDGTKVREHYRGIGSSTITGSFENTENFEQNEYYNHNAPFEIEISINAPAVPSGEALSGNSEAENLQKQQHAHPIIYSVEECINTILKKIKLKMVKPTEIFEALKKIQTGQHEAIIIEQLILDYLTKIKDQTKYQKVYEAYYNLKHLNSEINETVSRLKYLNNQNNIEGIVNELENLNTNFDEIKKQIHERNPLPKNKSVFPVYNIQPYRYLPSSPLGIGIDTTKSIYELPRILVDYGMKWYNRDNSMPDAAAFWEAASRDFEKSKEYITKNGGIVYSIDDLPSKELQDIVQKKVYEQLGVSNANGIILNSKSHLAQEVSISRELKDYYLKHKDKLQKGKVIKGGSTCFSSSTNMAKAIGHADIIYSYIDKQGDLTSILLDTYDFNKNDKDWKVKIARMAQEIGTIRNYYEIIITKTPKSVLETWE